MGVIAEAFLICAMALPPGSVLNIPETAAASHVLEARSLLLRAKDQDAWAELRNQLFSHAFWKTQNADDAHELAQEACLIALQALKNGAIRGNVVSFAVGVLHRTIWNIWKANGTRTHVPIEDYVLASPEAHPLDAMIHLEQSGRLSLALKAMEKALPLYYSAMVLQIQGLSTAEIAAELGITVSASRRRLDYGRKFLRERLNQSALAEPSGAFPGTIKIKVFADLMKFMKAQNGKYEFMLMYDGHKPLELGYNKTPIQWDWFTVFARRRRGSA